MQKGDIVKINERLIVVTSFSGTEGGTVYGLDYMGMSHISNWKKDTPVCGHMPEYDQLIESLKRLSPSWNLRKAKVVEDIANKLVEHDLRGNLITYVYIAIIGILPDGSICDRENEYIRIHDIISFLRIYYQVCYAESSRETIRKQAIKNLLKAELIEDNGLSKQSPLFGYKAKNQELNNLVK